LKIPVKKLATTIYCTGFLRNYFS